MSKSDCTPRASAYYDGTTCLDNKALKLMCKGLGLRIMSKPKSQKYQILKNTKNLRGHDSVDWPNIMITNVFKTEHDRTAMRNAHVRAFKPLAPAKNTWLASDQIYDYLRMLELYSYFKGILVQYPSGQLPKDYTEHQYKHNYLRILKRNPNWLRYVVVMNTSPYTQNGSHWVVIYVDRTTKTPGLEYFDGMHPNGPGRNTLTGSTWNMFQKWNQEGKFRKGNPLPVYINKVKKQRRGIECGMFVLWYVTNRLKSLSAKQLDNMKTVDDKFCSTLRNVYFRPNPN